MEETIGSPKCSKCGEKWWLGHECKRSPVEQVVGQALYWIDFKYKGKETRIKLEATSIIEAKKVARKQFGRKGKMIAAACVR